jgi:hypothetical protein
MGTVQGHRTPNLEGIVGARVLDDDKREVCFGFF